MAGFWELVNYCCHCWDSGLWLTTKQSYQNMDCFGRTRNDTDNSFRDRSASLSARRSAVSKSPHSRALSAELRFF